MIHVPHEDGTVSVLAGSRFFNNKHIGDHDNAAFLYKMVTLVKTPTAVWICQNDEFLGLLDLLLENAPQAMIAGIVLLLAWLMSRMRRFGPMLPEPSLHRRSLREHLDAAGRFLWRHKHSSQLLAPVRSEVERRIELRMPGTAKLSEAAKHSILAERAKLPVNRVTSALSAPLTNDARGFTEAVSDLVTLRDSL